MSILELVIVLYQGAGYLLRLLLYLCFWSIMGTIFLVVGLFNARTAGDGVTMAKEEYQSFVVRGEFPDAEWGD